MIDKYGLVVQENGDGGDCPCRCGVVIGWQHERNAVPMLGIRSTNADNLIVFTQEHLMPQPDIYYRYPVQYNQTNDFSRDQASRLMLGYGIAGRKDLVKGYYGLLIKNKLRHQNGDFMGTGEPGNIIRSLNWWALWPLLIVLDLKFLVDIIAYKWQSWDYDNLFLMDLYFAKIKFWTPTGWLARVMYDKKAAWYRIDNNFLNTANNGCVEAGQANLWFLGQL